MEFNNALLQSRRAGQALTEDNWRAEVRKRLKAVDWQSVVNDVRPSLEPSAGPKLLTHENLLRVLGN